MSQRPESRNSSSCQDHEDWDPYTFAINHKSGVLSYMMAKTLGKDGFREWFEKKAFYDSCADARKITPDQK